MKAMNTKFLLFLLPFIWYNLYELGEVYGKYL